MTLELSADEVLTTTRSVRRRLNLEKEVSPEILKECLNIALQAPTGSLRQDWHFVVSTDRDQCREVGAIYQEVWTKMVTDDYLNASASRQGEKGDQASWLNMMGSARHLAETHIRDELVEDEFLTDETSRELRFIPWNPERPSQRL